MYTGNEFRRLDHLINQDVAFVLEANCVVTPDLVDDLNDALREEAEKIRTRVERTLKCLSEANMRSQVQRLHQEVMNLLNALPQHVNALVQCIFRTLAELLNFVWQFTVQVAANAKHEMLSTLGSLYASVTQYVREEVGYWTSRQDGCKRLGINRVALDLSVAKLGCLFRAFIEVTKASVNVSAIARVLSMVVITKRSDQISVGNFRLKYYEIESSTKQAVIELLSKMIAWLKAN